MNAYKKISNILKEDIGFLYVAKYSGSNLTDDRRKYKYGKTKDLNKRISALKTANNGLDYEIIFHKKVDFLTVREYMVRSIIDWEREMNDKTDIKMNPIFEYTGFNPIKYVDNYSNAIVEISKSCLCIKVKSVECDDWHTIHDIEKFVNITPKKFA